MAAWSSWHHCRRPIAESSITSQNSAYCSTARMHSSPSPSAAAMLVEPAARTSGTSPDSAALPSRVAAPQWSARARRRAPTATSSRRACSSWLEARGEARWAVSQPSVAACGLRGGGQGLQGAEVVWAGCVEGRGGAARSLGATARAYPRPLGTCYGQPLRITWRSCCLRLTPWDHSLLNASQAGIAESSMQGRGFRRAWRVGLRGPRCRGEEARTMAAVCLRRSRASRM
jgi:hypothetical protein